MSEPTINGSVETSNPSIISNSRFFGHLYSYPTVNAAVDYAFKLPSVQTIANRAAPIVVSLKEKSKPFSDPVIKHAAPVLAKADELGDKILSRVDESFPQLKETKSEDVIDLAKKPYESVKSTADAYSTAAHDIINTNLVEPIKKAGERAKSQYISVYDNTGKPLIKNRIDPYVNPINHKFEDIIKQYLPEGSPEIPEQGSDENELVRAVHLAQVLLERARPLIDQQASQLATIPHATKEHVQKVYDEKLSEYGKDKSYSGPLYAYIATWRQLSSEGMMLAGSLLNSQLVFLKNSVGSSNNTVSKSVATNSSAVSNGDDSDNSAPSSASEPGDKASDSTTL